MGLREVQERNSTKSTKSGDARPSKTSKISSKKSTKFGEDVLNGGTMDFDALLTQAKTIEHEEEFISRDLLVQVVGRMDDRHDAFMTLPMTIAYTLVFISLVYYHLRISTRQPAQLAVREWINGRDPRDDCENNVVDIGTFWDWLEGPAGIENLFGDEKQSIAYTNITHFYVANRWVVIGDVRLMGRRAPNDEEKHVYLLSDFKDQVNASSGGPAQRAKDAVELVKKDDFWNANLTYTRVAITLYNEWQQMYMKAAVQVTFTSQGQAKPVMYGAALPINPYPYVGVFIADVLFTGFAMYMFFNEFVDMCLSLRAGCGELLDYFTFWNCVDWVSIILALTFIVVWSLIIVASIDEVLRKPLDADLIIRQSMMDITKTRLQSIENRVDQLEMLYNIMKMVMAANTVSIVLKFFKAFTSNPRLSVVMDTFSSALVDFFHFVLIFFTIFLPFGLIGHCLFGRDVLEFQSLWGSMNTAFLVLMGEFEWYVENCSLIDISKAFPSGRSMIFAFVWFALFMFLINLILLNMFLAIIIEHYVEVVAKMARGGEALTLWAQTSAYLRFRRETKKFISLPSLRRALEDDDDPAHPDDKVTEESLIEAFPDMTQEQAEWIMNLLIKEYDKVKQPHHDHVVDPMFEPVMELCRAVQAIQGTMQEAQVATEELANLTPEDGAGTAAPEEGEAQAIVEAAPAPEDNDIPEIVADYVATADANELVGDDGTLAGEQLANTLLGQMEEASKAFNKSLQYQMRLSRRMEDLMVGLMVMERNSAGAEASPPAEVESARQASESQPSRRRRPKAHTEAPSRSHQPAGTQPAQGGGRSAGTQPAQGGTHPPQQDARGPQVIGNLRTIHW
eukprot:TRINITY_DN6866_c0_g1_i2.p1 TRINITY_DN6866_c0_g1~~TRINITY_DN6866_c0_g1_i2.p1  ORF type:complete len:849 (-),score=152.54 TRINITY_DN6866_c0_g1_i2:145-2691(-)